MKRIVPAILTGVCFLLMSCERRLNQSYYNGIVSVTLNDTLVPFGGDVDAEFSSFFDAATEEKLGNLEMDLRQFNDSAYEYRMALDTYCAYYYEVFQVYHSQFTGYAYFNVDHPHAGGTYHLKDYEIQFQRFETSRLKGYFKGDGIKIQDSSVAKIRCDFDFFN